MRGPTLIPKPGTCHLIQHAKSPRPNGRKCWGGFLSAVETNKIAPNSIQGFTTFCWGEAFVASREEGRLEVITVDIRAFKVMEVPNMSI